MEALPTFQASNLLRTHCSILHPHLNTNFKIHPIDETHYGIIQSAHCYMFSTSTTCIIHQQRKGDNRMVEAK